MGRIEDLRTDEQKKRTRGFVVATDSFMSGWGGAPGRSLFAVPFETGEQAAVVLDNMQARSEMKRARIVGPDYRPALRSGDHLSIQELDPESGIGFYVPGYFATQQARRKAGQL